MIENHDHDARNKHQQAYGSDDLLSRRLLGRRTAAQAAFEKLFVMVRYVDSGERRRNRHRQEECPPLPIGQRPCRDENDGEEPDQAAERRTDCAEIETVHRSV